MRRLNLNLADKGWRAQWADTPAWLLVCGGLALLASALALWQIHRAGQAREPVLESIRLMERQRQTVSQSQPQSREPVLSAARIQGVNLAIQRLNVPWSELFDAIEASALPAVSVLELMPDVRKQQLRVAAEAASADAMVQFIERLKREGQFRRVVIERHDVIESDRNKPIRFEVDLAWQDGV